MLTFLPPRVRDCLRAVNLNRLYELRVRADRPLAANVGGTFVFLGPGGPCPAPAALLPTRREVEETLLAACGYSLYSAEVQLRECFVTAAEGERIGICGTVVRENGSIHAVREITSLCIRVPHEIPGCAAEIYRACLGDSLRSLLILSPPGEGKTTILRDLCRLTSERTHKNILVCDERGELGAGDLGPTADVIAFSDKLAAFTAGIRAMRPDVIVCDELLPEDYTAVRRAVESGIAVFASAHLVSFDSVPQKLFERYVILNGLGTVEKILSKEGERVD